VELHLLVRCPEAATRRGIQVRGSLTIVDVFFKSFARRYAVYGDMGNVNARSLGKIQREAQANDFDMILHVG